MEGASGEIHMKAIKCLDGGAMIEVYQDEGWGQLNVRVIPPGQKAGGHRHPRTDEWWMLARGHLWAWLEQTGREPYGKLLGPGEVIAISAGRGHEVENSWDEDAVLVFWRSRLYDPDDPDKEPWCQSCGNCSCEVE